MGANTKTTIDGIKAREAMINQALPEGVKFVVLYDQAELIEQAVTTVVDALLLAFVLIIVILALFLMNLSATFLVLISIPIAIGLALMVMAWLGISANLMSLGGLAVAIGMLVDGAVVMVENIFKHLVSAQDSSPGFSQGKSDKKLPADQVQKIISAAAKTVVRPIFFATAIILVVFMPLFSFEGVEAKLFQPMAISIMLAMLAALFVAIIIVPALASILFRHGITARESVVLKPITAAYRLSLAKALVWKKTVTGSALILMLSAIALIPQLGY